MQASRAMPGPTMLSTDTPGAQLPRRAALCVSAAAGAAVAAAASLAAGFGLGPDFVGRTALLVGGGGALVLVLAARHLRAGATFGAANAVTLARGALVLLLGALLWEDPGTGLGWAVVGLATVAAVLDAVDGKLARGRGETSGFGARFDMETDALFILVLSALVWQHGKAGAWILAAGLLRYGFVAAGRVFIALAAPLPPSRRRQTVCVLQIVSLISALAPIFVPPVSSGLALLGLGVLVWSFGVDVVWLTRRARG